MSKPVNLSQKSPNLQLGSYFGKSFWKQELENKDFVSMYRRGGVAFRVFNKEKNLLFKNGFTTNNDSVDKIIKDLKIVEIVKSARLNAQISGFCPVYMDFGDVNSIEDYAKPINDNSVAQSFFVIPVAWLEKDIYVNGTKYDHYSVYRADGSTFKIHESRIYRAKIDDEEISKIEPAYNALQVLDNVLWGTGQTMFRTGTGFPVLAIENSEEIVDYQGTKITRAQFYKKAGILKDMNTETGFVIDKRDEFEFVGAEGKAIKPIEYWDIALQAASIALDTPIDILKGVSAGAVTGSETNLRDYLADLTGKQKTEIQPMMNDLIVYAGQDVEGLEYEWNPIWEMTPQEITDTYSKDVIAFNNAENAGYVTHEQVINYFAEQYPEMGYDDLPSLIIPRPSPTISLNTGVQNGKDTISSCALPSHFDIKKIRDFYNSHTDDQIKKELDASDEEPSALPKSIQKTVDKFRKELLDVYKQTEKDVKTIVVGYNDNASS